MNPILIPVTTFVVTAFIALCVILILDGHRRTWRLWQVNWVFRYTDGTESAEKSVRFAARSRDEASFLFSSVVVIHGKVWDDVKFPKITSISEVPWSYKHIDCVRTSK